MIDKVELQDLNEDLNQKESLLQSNNSDILNLVESLDEDDLDDDEIEDDVEDIDDSDYESDEPDDLDDDYDEDALNRGDFKPAFFNRCRDNSVEWYTGQTIITATFSQRKWINKIKRLAIKRPDEVKIVVENTDSIVVHMPIGYVKISPPKQVSAEQRERMRLQAHKNIAEGKFGRKKKKVEVNEV